MNPIEKQAIRDFGISNNARVRKKMKEIKLPTAEDILKELK